ncbi:Gfo/Idh/MocA family oxidoreductase [Halosimplex rubrum]|uniref:Gfo/Idh/MocA family oxidoreductase n=1 Tax=Halosimplex rubrum TaxID=869889 RepID=A0A7D5TEW3_9EURY|nr:Gfo/Idh/MocA family oxidoreductase [Halosimplex rubrum]QLH79836.1 Gfo/Idh/MocA family oxidoreductase [Halosimplex rubrum]
MTVRIAIAGIGAVAAMHAESVADIDGAELVAGSCRTEERGREFAEEYDCTWYADTEAMLDAEAVDVLSVCTPSGAHLEPALAAADRGVDVLCEKPLEITTDRIDEMVAAADEAGIRLGGIFNQRYNPVVRKLREAASDGRFGSLSVANAYVPWWRDDGYYDGAWQGTEELDGGGALMNQSIHGIDAIQWIASAGGAGGESNGNPVEEVFAYTARRAHDDDIVEVEDSAVAVLRYRDGTLGQILGATSMYPGSLKRLQIAGRDGTAEIEEDELVTWRFREEREDDEAVRAEFGETESGGGAADPMSIDYANHRRNIADFLDARRTDEPYMLDASEARKAVAIIEAIYESAERGEPVGVA